MSDKYSNITPISGSAGGPTANFQQDTSAKGRFIAQLKLFLYKEKGEHIYDQVLMDMGQLFYDQLKNGNLSQVIEVPYTLDIDLMQLTFFDQFVAENLTRCLFRYSAHLSDYVRAIFLLKLEDEERSIRSSMSTDALTEPFKLNTDKCDNFSVKVNLKLSNLPTSVNTVDPTVLLSDRLLREYGQLVQVKLVRVVSIFEPTSYLYKQIKKKSCTCGLKRDTVVDINANVLKIFKNQVNYSTKMGQSMYYDICEDVKDTFCDICHAKFHVIDTKYAACQKAEILALPSAENQQVQSHQGKKQKPLQLSASISTCWLTDPFIGHIEVGDVINLTAFYYMSPQQTVVNQRCISPLVGSFVAFNILKVNPFNQMITRDSKLAKLFYNYDTASSINDMSKLGSLRQSKESLQNQVSNSTLTLENLKLHDRMTQDANNSFLPKMNRLVQHVANRPTTQFSGQFSIFEALYELENFGKPEEDKQSTACDTYRENPEEACGHNAGDTQKLSQKEYKDQLLEQLMQIDDIEQDFGKLHLLVDGLTQPKAGEKLLQNSHLFQLKFSLVLSAMVQMKNTLMKYMDYESRESNPIVAFGTQPVVIQGIAQPYSTTQSELLSVCTPVQDHSQIMNQGFSSHSTQSKDCNSRANLHLLAIVDDMSYLDSQVNILKARGIKVVNLPSMTDQQNLLPYLLINDHSILLIKNPRKDLLPMLKAIVRTGTFQKQRINLTLWVIIDVTLYLDKLVTLGSTNGDTVYNTRKQKKTLKDIIDKEYTIEFCQLFDIIADVTQTSNLSLLGSKYLYHQENYMVDVFLRNLEEPSCQSALEKERAEKLGKKSIFDFKDLKCFCTLEQQAAQEAERKAQDEEDGGYVLSLGETFIQYYYLCQRKVHQQYEQSYVYAGEQFRVSEKSKMSLADVVKVKKLADNINFMRLFFLKSNSTYISQRQQSSDDKRTSGLEVIDCVMAIFLFELTRAFRSSVNGQNTIYSKDQFVYKILHFFSTLRLAKTKDEVSAERQQDGAAGRLMRRRGRIIEEDSAEDEETDTGDLSQLIDGIQKVQLDEGKACGNCATPTQEISNFKVLYKTLIETVITNL